MKNKLKQLVVKILTWESGLVLGKFQPQIIAVTGNVGKTTTKDFIWGVLRNENASGIEKVRAAEKSQNSEFGVCLTILGEKNAWDSVFGWVKILTIGFLKSYWIAGRGEAATRYPETLILEIGADHLGDIKHITTFVKPNIVVLTAFQETPTHGEFFTTVNQHIREKKYLVDALKKDGKIIYNADDEVMSKMAKEKLEKEGENFCKIFSFGKREGSDVQILESGNFYNGENEVEGTRVRLQVSEPGLRRFLDLEIYLNGVLGEAQNYSLAASVMVAILKGKSLEEIQKSFEAKNGNSNFVPTNSRMRLLRGVNNLTIVDDSYNASPLAVENALDTIAKTFIKGKKIIVLGHMAELGEKTRVAHLQMGKYAGEVADIIIFSGRYNEHYLDGVRQTKFPLDKVFLAKDADQVIEIINTNKILENNDQKNINNIMLVKGSQSARLEKVVTEFLFDKRDAKKVCRQDSEWINRL